MKNLSKKLLNNEYINLVNSLEKFNSKENANLKIFNKLCEVALGTIKKGKKIIFIGNGGSAANAQHLATELTVQYKKKRKAINSISLSTDNSAITAIGNDFGFKFIFSRQVEAIGKRGDLVIALTTSGNSLNIIEACKVSNKMGLTTFCITGQSGGLIKKYVKNKILIPSKNTSIIQIFELFLGQTLCEFLEEKSK